MKKNKQLAGLLAVAAFLFFGAQNSFAQVTGNAFLSGQTNHSGIKVKFIPNSPTARLDSTFTSTNGGYSINLAGGLYQVLFSKAGYQNTYLNNGAVMPIATSSTLSNITIQPGNTVIVSGNASGTWSANNTYIVNGNITIPYNTSLTIAPGTVIKFNGNYAIKAQGTLLAQGTQALPITFTSNVSSPGAGNWDKIELLNSNSIIDFCVIEYCKTALHFFDYNAIVTNNLIRYCAYSGIDAINGTSTISNNVIHDYTKWAIFGGGSASATTITCNTIYNGLDYGIITNSNNIVKNNMIYNIHGTAAKGISVHAPGTPLIENNFIDNCKIGIMVGSTVTPAPNPTIVNNTLVNNTNSGIIFGDFYATGKAINNIITNNNKGITQEVTYATTPDMVAYNLVWNNANGNFSTVQKTGIGQMVTTNSNGHQIDSYYNLSQDPLFVNNTTPVLSANSPALNAGNPTYSNNIGYTSSSSCQPLLLSVSEDPISNLKNQLAISSYPNPFSESLNINFSLSGNNDVTIEIFDLTGKSVALISKGVMQKGEHELVFNGKSLRAGIYIIKVTTKDFETLHQKVIKL